MNRLKFLFFCTLLFTLIAAQPAYSQGKITLNEQFYQDGNFSIGMLNPVDEPFEQYKPVEMDYKVVKHVSRIDDDIELTALYLNYYRAPDAPSFWEQDAATRGAVMAAVIATDVPMSEDFGFTKLKEENSEVNDYHQKDIYYGLLVNEEKYIFAFRFIRRGGDEYVLAYRAALDAESKLSAEDFFNTFKLVK
jgi:hypothetical protein